ncbi:MULTISPECIES: site-specific integrase [Deefgea]|uniref:Tyrosine-type recombinase/integrase n=1 Tax=Deefgea chitinilytica TaxID=570276 RepID=A0ABS2CA54_9NEIS|nr:MULTISPECIES: site-specific integrase [Deefgea]MBM5570550.1 tyrosine-type recombinase/integrase [Deefgea chitinilytica]MBM9887779.1 site-specific integrase [Deefgea sp. CFH1-16]
MNKWKKILLPDFNWELSDDRYLDNKDKNQCVENMVSRSDQSIYSLISTGAIGINKMPVIVSLRGDIWKEAALYVFCQIVENGMRIETVSSIAEGLVAYKNFLEDNNLNWLDFDCIKIRRPTYRMYGELKIRVQSGEISENTASRIMKSVIGFYRWLIVNKLFKPKYDPWGEREVVRFAVDTIGKEYRIIKKKTDLSFSSSRDGYQYGETIIDGGNLKPIPSDEQKYICDFLMQNKNVEMRLIFVFALITGARIQTILTMNVEAIINVCEGIVPEEIRIPAGPATGIDTKKNKKLVIIMPAWFAMKLYRYIKSERASKRRALASPEYNNNVFLSKTGQPFYEKKVLGSVSSDGKRYFNNGQAVRQYLSEQMLPWIRKRYKKDFSFKFHDLRATFGMNLTEYQIGLVEKGLITLSDARTYVQHRMGHASAQQTDHYLNYKKKITHERFIRDEFYNDLQILMDQAEENE